MKPIWIVVIVIAFILLLVIQHVRGAYQKGHIVNMYRNNGNGISSVMNKSNQTCYFKPESDIVTSNGTLKNDGAYEIKPNGIVNIRVDGVATFYKPGMVFKIPNGGSVIIQENGDVDLNYFGIGDGLAYTPFAGWMNAPDKTWENLSQSTKRT